MHLRPHHGAATSHEGRGSPSASTTVARATGALAATRISRRPRTRVLPYCTLPMCSLCWVYFAGNRSRQYPFSPAHLTYFDETLMSKEPPQEKPCSCGRSTLAGLAGLAGLASLSGLSVVELWRQGPRPSRARNAPRHLSATRPDPATPVNISGRTERATDRATRVALPFNRGALRDRFLTFIRSRRGLPQLLAPESATASASGPAFGHWPKKR